MSPTPARTSRTAIVEAARALLEEEGFDGVTMAAVAERVGVRPPSLYKHVRDRAALLDAIAQDAIEELGRVMEGALEGRPGNAPGESPGDAPGERLLRVGEAFRALARRSPRSVALIFAGLGAEFQPSVESAAAAARPLFSLAAELAGADRALPAARVLTAFAYGFSAMENGRAFRFGGDVDEAFRAGLEALARGLSR
jgi:AcrR family transcriptional regulator